MNKLLITAFLIAFASIGMVIYTYIDGHKDDVLKIETDISKENSDTLQDFLYTNHGKFIELSVLLSDDLRKELLHGVDRSGRIKFSARDGENPLQNVQYVIKLLDSGAMPFTFDKMTGRLSGFFKTYRSVSPQDGSPIVNLVPIPSELLKEKDGIKQQ